MSKYYNEIDPKIKPFVEWLQSKGFNTIASCQGGRGHACKHPWVRIRSSSFVRDRNKLLRLLKGCFATSVSQVYYSGRPQFKFIDVNPHSVGEIKRFLKEQSE